MHEGSSFGSFLASDVLAVLEVKLYRLHPLLATVVGEFGGSVKQEVAEAFFLVPYIIYGFPEKILSHQGSVAGNPFGSIENPVDDRPRQLLAFLPADLAVQTGEYLFPLEELC